MTIQVPYFYTNKAFIPRNRVPPGLDNINFRCVLEEGLYQVGQRPAGSLRAYLHLVAAAAQLQLPMDTWCMVTVLLPLCNRSNFQDSQRSHFAHTAQHSCKCR